MKPLGMLAAIAVVLLSATAHAGALCGRVTDAGSAAPIPNAGVFVRTPAGAYTGDHAATDADGRYCISLAAGTYDLEFRQDCRIRRLGRGERRRRQFGWCGWTERENRTGDIVPVEHAS